MLVYVHRMPCREDDSVTAKDLSKVRDVYIFGLVLTSLNPFFFFLDAIITEIGPMGIS